MSCPMSKVIAGNGGYDRYRIVEEHRRFRRASEEFLAQCWRPDGSFDSDHYNRLVHEWIVNSIWEGRLGTED